MIEVLFLVVLAFAGGWLLLATLWFLFKLVFWLIAGTLGLVGGLLLLAVMLPLSLLFGALLLPVLLISVLPVLIPLLLVGGLIWLLLRSSPARQSMLR